MKLSNKKQKKTDQNQKGETGGIPCKQELGINLSALSEAQKKMCVRLLAQGNVEFIEKNNSYVATLKVPSFQLEQFVNKSKCSKEKKNKLLSSGKKNNENISTNDNKQIKKHQTHIEKKEKAYQNGKKPLSKVVKLQNIDRIEELHPEVDIYIYPKRLNFNVYQIYWNTCEKQQLLVDQDVTKRIKKPKNQNNSLYKTQNSTSAHFKNTFCRVFYQVASHVNYLINAKSKNINPKVDQFLVNLLDSIYHFQHKSLGVKLFAMFLTQSQQNDCISYFLILRALLEGIVGESILDPKNTCHSSQSKFNHPKKTDYSNYSIYKLKWNPYELEISQNEMREFLKVCLVNNSQFGLIFNQLTQLMYYHEIKKGNFIPFFDLIEFMLKDFEKSVTSEHITHLELSYSRDSTLNQILFSSTNRNEISEQPLQVDYQEQIAPIKPEMASEIIQRNSSFVEQLRVIYLQKIMEITDKMGINAKYFDGFIQEPIMKCLQAIQKSDKILWIQALHLEGTQAELLYIQNLQKQYEKCTKQFHSSNLLNLFIRKIIYGPGLMSMLINSINL